MEIGQNPSQEKIGNRRICEKTNKQKKQTKKMERKEKIYINP